MGNYSNGKLEESLSKPVHKAESTHNEGVCGIVSHKLE